MNHLKALHETDLERLERLKIFSWLDPAELKVLDASLAMSSYKRGDLIFGESPLANVAHVLVAGIVRVTCLNANNERVTVDLIPPGLIPELPSALMSHLDFRCEAYNKCRAGILEWKAFNSITLNGRASAFRKFYQHNLKHWYRLLRRTSCLLNLDPHRRVAITMLDLSEDFGVEDSRGTLLTVSFSHKDIASIVGASRPRVTEHLQQMERDHLLFRQGRQFIVSADKLSSSLASHQFRTHLESRRSNRLSKNGIQPPAPSVQSLPGQEKSLGKKSVFTQAD